MLTFLGSLLQALGLGAPAATSPSAAQPARATTVIGTPAGEVPATVLPGTGRGYFLDVVGESFHQDELREVWNEMKPDREVSVRLTAEPDNPYDGNAVAIQTFAGVTLGHLPRAEAARYQQLLLQLDEQGVVAICSARLNGGTRGKRSLGVSLDVERPTTLAAELGLTYKRVSPSPR